MVHQNSSVGRSTSCKTKKKVKECCMEHGGGIVPNNFGTDSC